MNLFQRVLRLPFVSKLNPVVSVGVWAVVTFVSFRNNVPIRAVRPVVTNAIRPFTPFTLMEAIISRFSSNRFNLQGAATADRLSWVFDTGVELVAFLIKNFNRTPSTEITEGVMPSIVSGFLSSNHIVSGMQGNTFIIGISEAVINYLGFTFVLFKSVVFFIGLICFLKFFYKKYFSTFIRILNDPTIDVIAKPLDDNVLEGTTPSFIEKYIKKQ